MNFTELQLLSVTRMAIEASTVDGECDPREKELILRHVGELAPQKLATLIFEKSLKMSVDEVIEVLRTMSLVQKRHFCAFIAMVILADEKIHSKELEFWGLLTNEAELPIMSFGEARAIFNNNVAEVNKNIDQYDELAKISTLRYLIEKHKLSNDYNKAQSLEQELLVLLQQKLKREQTDYLKYKRLIGSTDADTDNNIFNEVLSLISNEDEFVRFVFEELDAASRGEGIALDFIKECGIEARFYKGTLNSLSTIDRAGGPQQVLTSALKFIYGSYMTISCYHRIQIVKKFIKYGMDKRYLTKFASSNNTKFQSN